MGYVLFLNRFGTGCPKATGLLTRRGSLIRESEIFGAKFWGPVGTSISPLK